MHGQRTSTSVSGSGSTPDTLARVKANTLVSTFTGRLRDDASRTVTLTGTGGIGKTRLALHVGAEVLDEFASGVFFVSLAPIGDATSVVPAIAQALALREVQGEQLEQTLAEYLEDKQLLLILDNFEQVIEAASAVTQL